MNRKLLALAAGVIVGGSVVLVVRVLADRYAAEGGLPTALAAAREEVLAFAGDVRSGMTRRESDLRVALGLDAPAPGTSVNPREALDLLDDPARWRAAQG